MKLTMQRMATLMALDLLPLRSSCNTCMLLLISPFCRPPSIRLCNSWHEASTKESIVEGGVAAHVDEWKGDGSSPQQQKHPDQPQQHHDSRTHHSSSSSHRHQNHWLSAPTRFNPRQRQIGHHSKNGYQEKHCLDTIVRSWFLSGRKFSC
jgi:hypothetical protein